MSPNIETNSPTSRDGRSAILAANCKFVADPGQSDLNRIKSKSSVLGNAILCSERLNGCRHCSAGELVKARQKKSRILNTAGNDSLSKPSEFERRISSTNGVPLFSIPHSLTFFAKDPKTPVAF
jgi:hypothetical protein